MDRKRYDFHRGLLGPTGIDVDDATIASPELAALPAVTEPDIVAVVLDPLADEGDPEIVHVTDHAEFALTATVLRGQEDTTARPHAPGTIWRHVPTAADWAALEAAIDAALLDYQPLSEKDQAGGYPGLDVDGLLDPAVIGTGDALVGGFFAFDEDGRLVVSQPVAGGGGGSGDTTGVVSYSTTLRELINTTDETSISGALPLDIDPTPGTRFVLAVTPRINNTVSGGGAINLTTRFKLGGVTIGQVTNDSIANASNYGSVACVLIIEVVAEGSQRVYCGYRRNVAASGTALGDITVDKGQRFLTTQDLSASTTVEITCQSGTANADVAVVSNFSSLTRVGGAPAESEPGGGGGGGGGGDPGGGATGVEATFAAAPIGAATGVTGGGLTQGTAANLLTVDTDANSGAGSLRTALGNGTSRFVKFEPDTYVISLSSVIQLLSNTTLDGRGADVTIQGTGDANAAAFLQALGKQNIIIRNIKLQLGLWPGVIGADDATFDFLAFLRANQGDANSAGCSGIWVDHVSFFGPSGDGMLDITQRSTDFEVSWNYFHGSSKCALLGANSANPAVNTVVDGTMHHNFLLENPDRNPMSRHIRMNYFNNLVKDWGASGGATGGARFRTGSQVLGRNNWGEHSSGVGSFIAGNNETSNPAFNPKRKLEGNVHVGCTSAGDADPSGVSVVNTGCDAVLDAATTANRNRVFQFAGWQDVALP